MVDPKFALAPLPTRAYTNCGVVYPIACIRTNTVNVELPNGIGWQIGYVVQPGAQEDVIRIVEMTAHLSIVQGAPTNILRVPPDHPRHEHVIRWQELPVQNLQF